MKLEKSTLTKITLDSLNPRNFIHDWVNTSWLRLIRQQPWMDTGHRSIRGPSARPPLYRHPGGRSKCPQASAPWWIFLEIVSFFEWANMGQIISNYLIITFLPKE